MTICPVFWFTGLSGAGKTTVAERARKSLEGMGLCVRVIDGDEVRRRTQHRLGFLRQGILENNARIAEICVTGRTTADAVFVAVISPLREGRRRAHERIGDAFFEFHFSADRDTVERRDVKGMYAQAATGEITDMIGFSETSPYEPPAAPDLVIDSAIEMPAQSSDKLVRFVLEQTPASAA